MEPIISPWILYWISAAGGLKIAFEFGIPFTIFAVGFVYCAARLIIADTFDHDMEKELPKVFKIATVFVVVIAICLIVNIFIPTQETLYGMLALNYITPDNIELGVEGVKSIIEYIMETAATYANTVHGG